MNVYFLIGSSGTGKSHRASVLAHKYDIPLIVDDGLLIQGTRVLAGKSAKREVTRIAAVKRAIFLDDHHAQEVQEKIAESEHKSILVLGTSVKMAKRISQRLMLPEAQKVIHIEEIASEKSISTALHLRQNLNQHVIPIPTFEIKKDFPGYIIDPFKYILSKPSTPHVMVERSVIRPAYSSLGSFYIAKQALFQLVEHHIAQTPNVHKLHRVIFSPKPSGLHVNVEVILSFTGDPLKPLLVQLQRALKEELEFVTGFSIQTINITAKRLKMPED